MQLEFAAKLVGMYVDPILDRIFPNETGAARLQQIGLFTLIFLLEARGEPVTAASLSEHTGVFRTKIHKQMKKLLKLRLVGTRRAPNRVGRSYALHFFIKQNAKTKALLKEILRAADSQAKV